MAVDGKKNKEDESVVINIKTENINLKKNMISL